MRSRLIILAVFLVGMLLASPGSQAAHAGALALYVNFDYSGNITVTLPDGSPVGTTSGSPTVIPAGYYVVTLTQPGCVDVPTFILQGPGVNIEDDLQSGEIVTDGDGATFQPNSTYIWRNGSINPPVDYTFVTSGQVLGTQPPPTPATPVQTGSNKAESNTDVLGSQDSSSATSKAVRGTLSGSVTTSGRPVLRFQGKPVTRLSPGRYTITVADASTTSGLMVGDTGFEISVSSAAFTGTRSVSVDLTAGRWYYAAHTTGPKTYFTVS